MNKQHDIKNVRFDNGDLLLTIDGQDKRYSLDGVSRVLKEASDAQRAHYEISPSGYGIHWPDIDEDVSIDGLLGIVHEHRQRKEAA